MKNSMEVPPNKFPFRPWISFFYTQGQANIDSVLQYHLSVCSLQNQHCFHVSISPLLCSVAFFGEEAVQSALNYPLGEIAFYVGTDLVCHRGVELKVLLHQHLGPKKIRKPIKAVSKILA